MEKKILVTQPHLPDRERFDHYVDQIWKNKWLTNDGELTRAFSEALRTKTGAAYTTLFVNGHLALETALQGMALSGEVITTPYTFVSTVNAIVRSGLTPVFCDIKESNLTIDESKIERLITEKTCAILPVHVYGHCCNVERLQKIADKHGLKLIYDAAHAFGETLGGKSLVTYGDVSMVSFHATKIMNSIEGGALFFRDAELEKRFCLLRNFGIEDENQISCIGGNAKMNEFQAAMGLCNLPDLEKSIEKRKRITDHYRARLEGKRGIHCFHPEQTADFKYNYSYMAILLDERDFGATRDSVYKAMKADEIYTRRYFYPVVTSTAAYKSFDSGRTEIAKWAGDHILCLPDYDNLSENDVDRVCDALLKQQR